MINIILVAALWCMNVTVPLKTTKQCRKDAMDCLEAARTDDAIKECAKRSNAYE